ncbi:MAG: hypothetical protein ACLQVN_03270 [Bryobacteraceae bacterium]
MTETVKAVPVWLAVKLPVGEMASQVLPVQPCSDTEAVAAVLLCAVTVRVCATGAAAPATAVNVKAEALNVSGDSDVKVVTLRVTVTVWVPEDVAMEIVPVHAVPAAIPD